MKLRITNRNKLISIVLVILIVMVTCTPDYTFAKEKIEEVVVPVLSDKADDKTFDGIKKDGNLLISLQDACAITGSSIYEEDETGFLTERNFIKLSCDQKGKCYLYITNVQSKFLEAIPKDKINNHVFFSAFGGGMYETNLDVYYYQNEYYVDFLEYANIFGAKINYMSYETFSQIVKATILFENHMNDVDIRESADKLGLDFEQFNGYYCINIGTPMDELYQKYLSSYKDYHFALEDYLSSSKAFKGKVYDEIINQCGDLWSIVFDDYNSYSEYQDVLIRIIDQPYGKYDTEMQKIDDEEQLDWYSIASFLGEKTLDKLDVDISEWTSIGGDLTALAASNAVTIDNYSVISETVLRWSDLEQSTLQNAILKQKDKDQYLSDLEFENKLDSYFALSNRYKSIRESYRGVYDSAHRLNQYIENNNVVYEDLNKELRNTSFKYAFKWFVKIGTEGAALLIPYAEAVSWGIDIIDSLVFPLASYSSGAEIASNIGDMCQVDYIINNVLDPNLNIVDTESAYYILMMELKASAVAFEDYRNMAWLTLLSEEAEMEYDMLHSYNEYEYLNPSDAETYLEQKIKEYDEEYYALSNTLKYNINKINCMVNDLSACNIQFFNLPDEGEPLWSNSPNYTVLHEEYRPVVLIESIKDLLSPESLQDWFSNPFGKESIDYENIYYSYIISDLIPEFGLAQLEVERIYSYNETRLDLCGIVSASIYDFCNDGKQELLVLTREKNESNNSSFYLNLYSYDKYNTSYRVLRLDRIELDEYSINSGGEHYDKFELGIIGNIIFQHLQTDRYGTSGPNVGCNEYTVIDVDDYHFNKRVLKVNIVEVEDKKSGTILYHHEEICQAMFGGCNEHPSFQDVDAASLEIQNILKEYHFSDPDLSIVVDPEMGLNLNMNYNVDVKICDYSSYDKFFTIDFTALRDCISPEGTKLNSIDITNYDGRFSKDNLRVDIKAQSESEAEIIVEVLNENKEIVSLASYTGTVKNPMYFEAYDWNGNTAYTLEFQKDSVQFTMHCIRITNEMNGMLLPDINGKLSYVSKKLIDIDYSKWSDQMITNAINNYLSQNEEFSDGYVLHYEKEVTEWGNKLYIHSGGGLSYISNYYVAWNTQDDMATLGLDGTDYFCAFNLTDFDPLYNSPYIQDAVKTETGDDESLDWHQLYDSVKQDYIASNFYNVDAMYEQYDIDGNGVPELIISSGLAHMAQCMIYTIYNGQVVNLGEYGEYGYVSFDVTKGLLCSAGGNQGYFGGVYYKLENGELTMVFSYSDNEAATDNENERYYTINGDNVSKKEYDNKLQEYNADEYIYLGRARELTN